jgi:hypothetical protein
MSVSGLCPICQKVDGYLSGGFVRVFYCREHRKKWFLGHNSFMSPELTEEELRSTMLSEIMSEYELVDPYFNEAMKVQLRAIGWVGGPIE